MNGKWNNEFGEVNLIKEIKLRSWLKASFYDTSSIGIDLIWYRINSKILHNLISK